MLLFTTFLFVFSTFTNAFGSELCKDKEWFNDLTGKCQTCKVCSGDSKEMAPCLEFADTMCVDIEEIRRFLAKNMAWDPKVPAHPWHETEGKEDIAISFAKEKVPISAKSYFDNSENMWSEIILVILSVAFIFMISAIVLMILRYFGKFGNRNDNRKTNNRARLFSRDRLNTTEYMNNLATLDRRLAIDEILEKRKRAIFEPQLLSENVYTDEVFVDISGLPREHARENHHHDYEELDHRKCLLQMQEPR